MRLSSVSLPVVLLFATSSIFAQHSSGGGSSSGGSSSGGSSSGGGSHSSSSGGSGSSGGSSHSSGGGSGYSGGSHGSGGSHSSGSSNSDSGGGRSSPGAHTSGSASIYRGSGPHVKNDRGSNLSATTHNGSGKSEIARPIHEPRVTNPQRNVQPERRGFFSRLFHPIRKQPKPEPKPAIYLPRPICPHGRCAPACPVGQVRNGGTCTIPVIQACVSGQQWNSNICGYNRHYNCPIGQNWNGVTCAHVTSFLDNCAIERDQLQRQIQRVQDAEFMRQRECASGMTQECSQATATWQYEESLRRNLLSRYNRCEAHSASSHQGGYYSSAHDSIGWFDSLRFDTNF